MQVHVVRRYDGQYNVWRRLHNDWAAMQWEVVEVLPAFTEAAVYAATLPKKQRYRIDYVGNGALVSRAGHNARAG